MINVELMIGVVANVKLVFWWVLKVVLSVSVSKVLPTCLNPVLTPRFFENPTAKQVFSRHTQIFSQIVSSFVSVSQANLKP